MAFLQNIIFVTYLKNKGVRRICFIVGILLTIIPTCIWYEGLSKNFYNETYENILKFAEKNKYDTEKQKEVFNKYPVNVRFSNCNLDDFYKWQEFFINGIVYTNKNDEKSVVFTICAIINQNVIESNKLWPEHIIKFRASFPQYNDLSNDKLIEKLDIKYNERCKQLKQYMSQKISISKANYLYLLKLIWSLFWFYIPFLLSCIVKWIYMGFKEK